MAKKRFFRKRRPLKKRFRRRRKTNLTKTMTNRGRCIRTRIMGFTDVGVGAGEAGLVKWTNAYPINYPGMYENNEATYGELEFITNHLGNFRDVFDLYKVISVKLVWIPSTNITATYNTLPNFDNGRYMYVKRDDDDCHIDNTQTDAETEMRLMMDGSVPKSMNRRQIYTMYHLKGQNKFWFNSANMTHQRNTTDFVYQETPPPNSFGGIKLIFPNLIRQAGVSTIYGRVFIIWDVIFKGLNDFQTPQ